MRRFIQLLALLLMVPFGAMAEEPLYKDFQELQLRLEEANNRMIIIRVIFIAALIVIIVVFQYLRLKDRRRREVEKQENERILAIAEDLRARLDDAESAAASASAEKNSMLEKMGFSVLERLCEQYYIYEGTDNLQPKLLKEAKSVIEDLRSDSGQLEKTLDVQKNNLVARFRAQFPKVKEEDVRLFTFLAAGFNSTTISTLMGKDKQNIYNKIWRLKTRISDSGVPDKDLFLRYFSK
ncbi:MAG: hypothetical protein SPL35_07250 [Bacteroidales bacterium]|nr:hypothetical protein [Bacteroidales bacterium]